MLIREINEQDLLQLLTLYTYLHDNSIPSDHSQIEELWKKIVGDSRHHIVVGIADNAIICSCVLDIVPNLTHQQRPYALIENVITHPAYRNKGYATQILEYAKEIAMDNQCYKIMLMTGSKKESIFRFYQQAGYNKDDKTAFIQWLD